MSARPFDLGKLDTEAIRHKQRKKMLVFSLPGLILFVLIAIKLLSMSGGAMLGVASFHSGDTSGAIRSFSITSILNIIEPYKAPFNIGTTQLRAREYEQAERNLQSALTLAPVDKICLVRVNLALVYEGMGDQLATEKEYTNAAEQYSKARETVVGDNCTKDPGKDGNNAAKDGKDIEKQQAKQRAASVQNRAESKSSEAKQKANNEPSNKGKDQTNNKSDKPGESSDKKPDESSIDKLKQQQKSAEQERRSQQRRAQDEKDYKKRQDSQSYNEPMW